MAYGNVQKLFSHPDGEKGFGVLGYATSEPFHQVLNPKYLRALAPYIRDGDFMVVNRVPNDKPAPYRRPYKLIVLLHKDRDDNVDYTRLAEIPPGGPLIPFLEGVQPLVESGGGKGGKKAAT